MAESELVIQGEASRTGLSARDKVFLGAAVVGTAVGAFLGYELVVASDQDESAVVAHNVALDECLDLTPEEQLTDCAPKLIYNFGIDNYVNIDRVSLSAGGTLVPVVSIDEKKLDKDLKDSKQGTGFEPEHPVYKVVGALIGGALGAVVGTGVIDSVLFSRRHRQRKVLTAPAV